MKNMALVGLLFVWNSSHAQISQNSQLNQADPKVMYNNPDPLCTLKNHTFIPLPDSITHGQLISFMRVHPSGQYVAITIPNTLAGMMEGKPPSAVTPSVPVILFLIKSLLELAALFFLLFIYYKL